MQKVSVIIPAHNEEKTILECINRCITTVSSAGYTCEVVVVDDGSTDQTAALAKTAASSSSSTRLVEIGENRGKGYALKRGFYTSSGDLVTFIDADLAIPPEQIPEYVELLKEADVVIASRLHKGSKVRWSTTRKTLSMTYNLLVLFLVSLSYRDTQCGLKCFRRDVLGKVLPFTFEDGYSFDVEILLLLDKNGFRVVEAPVNVRSAEPFGLRDMLKMFWEILSISYRLHIKDSYSLHRPSHPSRDK